MFSQQIEPYPRISSRDLRQATNGNLDQDLTAVILWTIPSCVSVFSVNIMRVCKDLQRKTANIEQAVRETITDIISPPIGTGFGRYASRGSIEGLGAILDGV